MMQQPDITPGPPVEEKSHYEVWGIKIKAYWHVITLPIGRMVQNLRGICTHHLQGRGMNYCHADEGSSFHQNVSTLLLVSKGGTILNIIVLHFNCMLFHFYVVEYVSTNMF